MSDESMLSSGLYQQLFVCVSVCMDVCVCLTGKCVFFRAALDLCVGIEAFFGARGVDVVQLLLLLRLYVFVLLHPAGIFQVAPVSRQSHQEVDLRAVREE